MSLYATLEADHKSRLQKSAAVALGKLLQKQQYVGEVFSLSYDRALVQIHDYYRQAVGGIPSLSFLLATRLTPEKNEVEYEKEDSSIILLRVMDSTRLPNDDEALRLRVQSAQQVSGELEVHWEERRVMDAATHHVLSYAGIECRVIGTFFLDQKATNDNIPFLGLRFGSDISNYYPNKGLKVYKPNGEALRLIVNYRDPSHRVELRNANEVKIGTIRYASTNRTFQGVSNVEVSLAPADLLGQKSALFGMTRTGKSNTTKILAKSVFELRFSQENSLRVGQIIFDPNGEYANENAQDNNNALKNVWRINERGVQEDVVTYGILRHPNDPGRRLMLLNFYTEENLQIGKEIIDAVLANDTTKFITNFTQVSFTSPDEDSSDAEEENGTPSGETNDNKYNSANVRYRRRVLAYRALLFKAGFTPPVNIRPETDKLFNAKLIESLNDYDGDERVEFQSAAKVLANKTPAWGQVAQALESLYKFMSTSKYKSFEEWYVNKRPKASGDTWADDDLKKILEMFSRPNGSRQIGRVKDQHTHETNKDYADEIYAHLVAGRLVIVDQSSGDPEINDSSARRILWKIFDGNRKLFREGKKQQEIPDILVFAEEAHNLLPPSKDDDLKDIWVRAAKEGAKYHIGMLYTTQEVSSIQRNILKNTANWFIGHLNNTDETRELCKFYDFKDFEPSILRNQDKGFLRVKTLSNPFIIPVQVDLFAMPNKEVER